MLIKKLADTCSSSDVYNLMSIVKKIYATSLAEID